MLPNDRKEAMGLAERLVSALERKLQEEVVATSPAGSGVYIPLTVEAVDTHVYFYAPVNTDRCLDLLRNIRELDNRLRNERLSRMIPDDVPATPIWLHIQSGGGGMFSGFNLLDQLAMIKTPIYSIVEGICASAATMISMACTKRFIMPSSFMLIHQISSVAWGTYEQIKDDVHLLDMAMERLYSFYTGKSNLTKTQVKAYLKKDTWFSAEECLENGLVDEILT
jgi:ATP-dependent protease ClpP protease subunit